MSHDKRDTSRFDKWDWVWSFIFVTFYAAARLVEAEKTTFADVFSLLWCKWSILYNDIIRGNISFGKDGKASETEIIVASELANVHEFICGLHQGYDTMLREQGIKLSGGQKQRVVFARAIVKSPKILLLDEATSALDAESEKVVQDALDKVMVNRTTVVVAHRLSTIRGADVIGCHKERCHR
ncbi:ABC transporter B family member 21-like protein [Tanacetum coccineum]